MNIKALVRRLLSPIKQHLLLSMFQVKWREANEHNMTRACNIFPLDKVRVGNHTYGELTVYAFGGEEEGLEIGHYCSIAGNVVFLLGGEHPLNRISTFPFARMIYGMADAATGGSSRGKIRVGDDVWIGNDVCILSGVNVGQGAVIGAGSVVAKDIPPYAIYAGNKVIRYRFSETVAKKLQQIDYSKLEKKQLEAFRNFCNTEVTEDNVTEIVASLM